MMRSFNLFSLSPASPDDSSLSAGPFARPRGLRRQTSAAHVRSPSAAAATDALWRTHCVLRREAAHHPLPAPSGKGNNFDDIS